MITDFLSKTDTGNFLEPFWEYINNPGISWTIKNAILEFLSNLNQQRDSFRTGLQQTIDFFLHFFDNQSITLIYRRQIFVNMAIILQAWIKAQMIPPEQAKTLIAELLRIDKNLKKTNTQKNG